MRKVGSTASRANGARAGGGTSARAAAAGCQRESRRFGAGSHGLTPKAFANSSPGVASTLGSRYQNQCNPERVCLALIPNVALVVLYGMHFKKQAVFILEAHSLVMLLLILDVRHHRVEIR